MRVLLNVSSTIGKMAGVGRYSEELLRCLQARMLPDELFAYPHQWIRKLRSRWMKSKAPNPSMESAALPRRRFPSARQTAVSLLRPMGHALLWAYDRSVLREKAFDLYHEPNFIPISFPVPTVVTIHDLSVLTHPEWHPPHRVALYDEHFSRTLKQAVHFITGTEQVRREMVEMLNIPAQKITCTHYGARHDLAPMSKEQIRPALHRLGLPENYLLHLGTIEPRKNVLRLMRAYVDLPAELRNRFPLVLAGSWGWRYDDTAEFFHKTAKHQGVIQTGFLPDEDLQAVYNGARALVFPTLYEGFGIPAIEMMKCGGAVLASTAGAVAEVVGQQTHLIAPDNVEGWRDAMLRVLTDDDWWLQLRKGTVNWAERFTWERCAEETLEVYRRLTDVPEEIPATKAA